ncbi:MAG: peptidylprolyl isomerase [Burkholderiales bacterium]|nr:peptidylprolyl isomerase [Opitutaceae bacterium]
MTFVGSILRFVCATLVAAASALAANLAPTLLAPLPSVTLEPGTTGIPLPLADHFRDPDVPGSAARITIRIGATTRVIDLALFDATAPLTTANFLAYVDAGRFAANFFHRSVPGFVIQNGGFRFLNNTTFDYVPTFPPVLNEPGASNLRGTVAMAKLGGDPNSATSQWFINLADNSANLDAQNGGFTVFARVLGTGMAVADEIAALPYYDTTIAPFYLPWDELPLSAPTLARSSFIETSAARVAPLSYTVTVDDPTLVTATIADGKLLLSAAPGRTADTTVYLTATDLEGGVLETSFTVAVATPATLSAWRQIHFATAENTGPAADTADPDADGIPNLLEYALALDPRVPARAGLPLVATSAGTLTLTYRQARADLSYTVQTTPDLAAPDAWTTAGVTPGAPDTNKLVTASVALADPRRFLRLNVAPTP